MGVADSPDLANLYGWHFEKKAGVLEQPQIPFYGRYIDDCLAIVYASNEQEAVAVMDGMVRFDNCVIEWSASDLFQPFLDMMLYRDDKGTLQHMPYRKAQNLQERIPWISHHPFDVKRGTFIGEMSRLATLSSTRQHYYNSMKSLVALYVARGYPEPIVLKWLRDNLHERWDKRLSFREATPGGVLVLKTEYNTAWNYFSAKELGDTILNYWREWLSRADRRDFNHEFPAPDGDNKDLPVPEKPGSNLVFFREGEDPLWVPDLRQLDIFGRRMITSRKRTRNLFDLTGLWKNIVLEQLDEKITTELEEDSEQPVVDVSLDTGDNSRPSTPASSRMELHFEDPVVHNQRRSSPPVPDAWTYGRW